MKWKHTYDVNKYVREGSPENVKAIAQKIFDALNGKPGFNQFNLRQFLTVKTVDQFDIVWNRLYDYADAHGIWLGL